MQSDSKRDRKVARLIRAGELEVSGENPDELATYFDAERFRFHGPDGFESDFKGLNAYFASIRDAFDNRSIRRGIVVVEDSFIACQTWIDGVFVRPFVMSPAGELPPTGAQITMDLINIFRLSENDRLLEEFVRTDYRSFLRQLGAPGA